MSTQWEIDLILNVRFTFKRLKLSCTINPAVPLKVKLVIKHFLKNMPKHIFNATFQFSKTLV